MATVLIVDDSPMQIKLLRKVLEQQGHRILEAENGARGMELTKTHRPDLVMLDVIMPDVNGFDVTRQIRKDHATKDIPIVLVSSKSQETDKQWGMRQGANGYLVKPFNKIELLAAVSQFINPLTAGNQATA